MFLHQERSGVQTPENANYADYGEKSYKRSMQSDVHSHMMVDFFLNLKGLNPDLLKTHT